MMRRPGLGEDTRNLALIGGSALAAVVATVGLVLASSSGGHAHRVHVDVAAAPAPSYELVEPLSGTNRLYGTVETRHGDSYQGFIRWDRNEGSWGDLLDATKRDGNFTGLSGIRFGHVQHIQSHGSNQAVFTLRSGHTVRMQGGSSDLGRGLRALLITDPVHGQATLDWHDIRQVTFQSVPQNADPPEGRLHGTLTTASGMEFTGYIAWDVDEIYSTDVLDGEADGRDHEVPFGAIESIRRGGSRSAHVVLHSGERLTLSGTNDVNKGNRGITVSDPALGQAKVMWGAFASVRFHGADAEGSLSDFNGGEPLRGTVITASGDALAGEIKWDRDESQSWEMLNGTAADTELDIEFSNIARIVKNGPGSTVVLRDGRSFDLRGSNDVDGDNRGIVVTSGNQPYTVEWDDFRELRLDG